MQIDFNRYKKDKKTDKAIIAIHGWGGNKDSFLPFAKNIKIPNVEWFLPEAPYLIKDAPSINSDDSQDNDLSRKSWTYKKEDGMWELNEPIDILNNFFDNIIFKEYDSKNVYVLGFSQGAAVCYEYVLGINKSLGGVFPIGGFLFKYSDKIKRVSLDNKNTPVIIGHGSKDDVIPIEKSRIAYSQLLKEGANVKFLEYNGGHKISMNYLREVVKVIDER
tara:strand:+ start:1368 stop:2024 length:657 start_codon:yes stop_codon:yes gene_type:complete